MIKAKNNRVILMGLIVTMFTVSIPFSSGQARFIGKDFINYCSKVPWEDIFLHTDREQYIAGENIWFTVYAIDRQHLKASSLSSIAYVELLNYNNRPVIRGRILLSDGSGLGQINLPDTLSSGIYTLRAYTAWMKNFLPEGCFTKEIGVYNAISLHPTARKPIKKSESDTMAIRSDVKSGFQLITDNDDPDVVHLSFITSDEFRKNNGPVCNIFIHTRGNINLSEAITLTGNATEKIIGRSMLLPGINHITVFDARGVFLTERFIYTQGSSESSMNILSDLTFGKRDNVILSINSEASDFRNLSVSVSPSQTENSPGLQDFLIFGTEFGYELAKKFQKLKIYEHSTVSIDSLLANVRSSWINWNVIAGKDSLVLKYQPETSAHFLSGKLINSNTSGDYVIMSIPGKQAVFKYAKTDPAGNFNFSIPVDEEMQEIIIQPDDIKGIVNIGSSFLEEYPVSEYISEKVPDFVTDLSVNFQVQKIYETVTSENIPPEINSTIPKRFYGKPDIELVLSDYIKLPVMDEIFFELLPGTYLKKRKSSYEIYVTDPVSNLPYDYPTTLFVDGVRIDDAGAIAAIDPEFVEKIDVVRDRYLVGDYLFHGLVNIITKAGDFTAVPIPEYAVRTYYRVIDPIEKFIAPDYKEQGNMDRIPDFRNTLWWDPSVKTKDPVEFWSSDVPGKYRIRINGTDAEGSPVSAEKIITIE